MFWMAAAATNLAHAAAAAEAPLTSGPWVETIAVLVLTFGVAATAGFLLDAARKTREKIEPGVDAYIDHLVAGNGTRLTRLPETGRR